MKKTIKRRYLRNRHGIYNGKIKYSFTHQGETITRTSRNLYEYAAVADLPNQTKTIWSSKPIDSKRFARLTAVDQKNITHYRMAIAGYGEHMKWKCEWSIIWELSSRNLKRELNFAETPKEAQEILTAVKKHPTIGDIERRDLIQQTKTTIRFLHFNEAKNFPERTDDQVDFLDLNRILRTTQPGEQPMNEDLKVTADSFQRQLESIEREIAKFKKFIAKETTGYGTSRDPILAAQQLGSRLKRRASHLKEYGDQLEEICWQEYEKNGAEADRLNETQLQNKLAELI